LHLSSSGKLLFYDINGNLLATGSTTLVSGQVYTISAKIGTGSNAPWEVRLDGKVEMSGTGNLGGNNNGSIKLGGGSPYTCTYTYDDVAIASLAYPGTMPTGTVQFAVDGTNFGSPVPVTGGTASSAPNSTLTTGNHTITASYSGDSVFPSSSGTLAGGETIASQATASTTTTAIPLPNGQTVGQPVSWIATVTGQIGPVNSVNFETGDFSQLASHTGGSIITTPALDGAYSLQLQRSNSVANAEIRQSGSTYYNLPTAYYSFLFESTSNPSEGGIVNFQDTTSGYKAALHLSSSGKLLFYNVNGTLLATGTTTLLSGQAYTISAKIGTGSNAPWEIRINGNVEMSGTGNLGGNNNGSIRLGGNSAYTCTYLYDDVAIASLAYPGTMPTGTVQFAADGVNLGNPITLGNPTFTLTFDGRTTTPIPSSASGAIVQAALAQLSTVGTGNVLVSGPIGGPWEVRFVGQLGGKPQVDLIPDGSQLAGGTVAVGTVSQGGDAGRVQQITDPRGLISKTDYDLLGRTVRTIDNFVAFAPSNGADRTTEYTYDGSDHVIAQTAVLPVPTMPETTHYTYGVTGSVISSNDLLASVTYPPDGQNATESYTYNALGQVATMTDRNGNVHTYTYDVLGRQSSDAVTTLGSGVDGTVRRIDTAYDTGDRPSVYTSYADAAGTTVVNQVQQIYNGLGQLITEYQSQSGAVNTSSTPKIQYAYSEMAGGANHSRLTTMTYPNGRVITYNYASGVDDAISRITSLSDSSATLEAYSYLGLDTVVTRARPQPGINQTYIIPGGNSDGGDQYTGLDRFGRVVDQNWIPTANPTMPTDRFQYGYDADGNPLYRDNLVNSAFGELYHANGPSNGYDGLNQLTAFSRGALNTTKDSVMAPSHVQSWSLDSVGNWASFSSDSTLQTRMDNLDNEITMLSAGTNPSYDADGNTTRDDSGNTYVYDAWIS